MNKLTINVDIDNTVNNFIDHFVNLYNSVTNSRLFVSDVTNYDLSIITGVDRKTLATLFFKNNDFYKELDSLPYTYEVLYSLYKKGHNVRFVTSINYEVIQPRIDFIHKKYPFIDSDRSLIVTDNKNSIWADIVIDDLQSHFDNRNGYCKYILFSRPWNLTSNENPNICKYKRCKNWKDIEDYFKELQII